MMRQDVARIGQRADEGELEVAHRRAGEAVRSARPAAAAPARTRQSHRRLRQRRACQARRPRAAIAGQRRPPHPSPPRRARRPSTRSAWQRCTAAAPPTTAPAKPGGRERAPAGAMMGALHQQRHPGRSAIHGRREATSGRHPHRPRHRRGSAGDACRGPSRQARDPPDQAADHRARPVARLFARRRGTLPAHPSRPEARLRLHGQGQHRGRGLATAPRCSAWAISARWRRSR